MSADDDHFITPPAPGLNKGYSYNNVYEIGETVTLSWVKSFPTGTLTLTQDNKPGDQTGGPSRNIKENGDFSEYTWIVDYFGLDPKVNNVFYFSFGPVRGEGFESHYFNITDNANDGSGDDSSLTSSATTLISTTTAASTFSGTFFPPSTTSSITSTSPLRTDIGSPSTESLSAGGIAGIAVGVTLGTISVVAGLGLLVWRKRNRRKAPVNPTHDTSQYPYPQVFVPVEQPQQLMSTPAGEIEGVQKYNGHHEMPG